MIENMRQIFQSKDHKEIMLGGLLISSVVIYELFANNL